jgi:hypothetical protein
MHEPSSDTAIEIERLLIEASVFPNGRKGSSSCFLRLALRKCNESAIDGLHSRAPFSAIDPSSE